jgi:DNA-binding transcriptional LysR family regulator
MRPAVELRELQVFLAVAEELHFGRAAERLGLTGSRASQVIHTLETRIGGRLFERTSRRVGLTPLGEELLARLEPVYKQLQGLLEETREIAAGVTGSVRIGSFARFLVGPHMPEIIDTFEARHAECHVTYLDTGVERDHLDWLRADDLDLVCCWLPVSPPEFTAGSILLREDRILVVARDHPLARRDSVGLEDLVGCPVNYGAALNREMMDAYIPPTTPSGVPLNRVARRTLDESIMSVLNGESAHLTVTSVLEQYSDLPVTAVPLSDLPAAESALVWRTADRSHKVQAFARVAAEVLAARCG